MYTRARGPRRLRLSAAHGVGCPVSGRAPRRLAPARHRSRARGWRDRRFADLPHLLRAGDCVILNDSRVIPARVFAQALRSHRAVEIVFVAEEERGRWRALVRPGRHCRPGTDLLAGGEARIRLRVVGVDGEGLRIVERLDGTIPELMARTDCPPCPRTSRATRSRRERTGSATRLSTRGTPARWRHRRPGSTSLRRCSTPCAPGASRSTRSPCTSGSPPSGPCVAPLSPPASSPPSA